MRAILIPLAGVFIALPLGVAAYKEGPYPNVAGGFGDQTCHQCHLDNPMNAPGGLLAIAGVPPTYAPRQSYPITVTLTREDMRRGGFEIVARFAAGALRGRQAGSWTLRDARVQMIPGAVDPALRFVQHTLAGSRTATKGVNSWTIDWTAPDAANGAILFNVAGNASNNDDSPLGDFIYTKSARSVAGRPSR